MLILLRVVQVLKLIPLGIFLVEHRINGSNKL